jgi:signal peptidase II
MNINSTAFDLVILHSEETNRSNLTPLYDSDITIFFCIYSIYCETVDLQNKFSNGSLEEYENYKNILNGVGFMKLSKRFIVVAGSIFLFCATVILDRFTKQIALERLPQSPVHVFSILEFVYVENYGAVFGLFSNQPINFAALSIGSIVVILLLLHIFFKNIPWLPVSLILGGAVGNIIDRYLYGFVVDFIKVDSFYVFNIADACITIGAGILFIIVIKEQKEDSKKEISPP